MALSKKSLQLKRQKKNKKHQPSKKNIRSSSSIVSYDNWPLYESLIQADIWEQGIGHVIVTRENSGKVIAGIYLIDTFCLGIKNCFAHSGSMGNYQMLRESLEYTCGEFEIVEHSYAAALIYQAMKYAEQLGFKPHLDFNSAGKILKNIAIDENQVFNFGREGKPCYISGPNESPADIKKILRTLEVTVGLNEFDYILQAC